jgi:hypothetical protein
MIVYYVRHTAWSMSGSNGGTAFIDLDGTDRWYWVPDNSSPGREAGTYYTFSPLSPMETRDWQEMQ